MAIEHDYCLVERDGPITIVTLNRPEVMNALHSLAHVELARVFDDFEQDPEQWVAIVIGADDRAFCAGNDLKFQADGGELALPPSGFGGLTSRFDLTKPVIAAVNGVAMGAGFELALACDIILAAETATFALPEPRVGLAALGGGLHRLPRAIGTKRAMALILTARRVSARDGLALGFVSEVAPQSDLLRVATDLAREICALSPMSVRASKQALYRGLDEPSLSAAIEGQMGYPAVAALWASEDFKEGPAAFAAKRAPMWRGR